MNSYKPEDKRWNSEGKKDSCPSVTHNLESFFHLLLLIHYEGIIMELSWPIWHQKGRDHSTTSTAVSLRPEWCMPLADLNLVLHFSHNSTQRWGSALFKTAPPRHLSLFPYITAMADQKTNQRGWEAWSTSSCHFSTYMREKLPRLLHFKEQIIKWYACLRKLWLFWRRVGSFMLRLFQLVLFES